MNKENISFNLEEFIKQQTLVNDKFPVPDQRIEKIVDNFILHIVEECYEVDCECENVEEYQGEIIDVFMYLGSFFSDLYKRLDDKSRFELRPIEINYNNFIKNRFHSWDIITALIKIRMKFPERKYHKKYEPLSYEADQDRIFYSLQILTELMSKILNENLYVPYEEFGNRMIAKRQFILNL